MPGFDSVCDKYWRRYSEFDFEFEDCFVHIEGIIHKSWDDGGDLNSQNMEIHKNQIQYEEDEKQISFVDIQTIEESIGS